MNTELACYLAHLLKQSIIHLIYSLQDRLFHYHYLNKISFFQTKKYKRKEFEPTILTQVTPIEYFLGLHERKLFEGIMLLNIVRV